ncbi:response regulator [Paenibacillus sp. LMG 31459]|uniref:Response regulator n=1 Tax=Paenibacillus phytohabitans TaxID=2654978 RepID=A0ABX1YG97_9BACL|nr:response regulator [Paenibacillus phytohabitans]NOU79006.1 response regulator [Paenibacillus phytohabitans]
MIRLLIVDDEQTTHEGLMNYIEWRDLGIDMVKAAGDGWEALQLCGSFRPDIVLTDVKMPRMDGIELAMKLKQLLPQCKVLFLSSYADKAYLKSAIQLKALDYIEKPVNLDHIREHIRHAVELCLEERKMRAIEHTFRNQSELLEQEQQALFWIAGNVSNNQDEMLIRASTLFPQGASFVTAVIKLHHLTEQDNQNLMPNKNTLLEQIGLRFSAISIEVLRGFKDPQHIIIHAFSRSLGAPEDLVNALALIRSDIQAVLQKPLLTFIGVGQLVHHPERLITSYHTAVIALQRQFFKGYNHIIVYHEQPRAASGDSFRISALESTFAISLEQENEKEAFALVADAASALELDEDLLVNDAKNIFSDLLLTLFKFADQKKVTLAELREDREYLWNVLFQFNTLHEMTAYTEDKLTVFFNKLRDKPSGGSITSSIQKCVHANYKKTELSIKMIADQLFLTPNYLSLQFKKETGITINQYITDYRIAKAKELLADRQYKLYEIAAHVGIQDANYFAKTFKKVTGMTPSEYKEKHT